MHGDETDEIWWMDLEPYPGPDSESFSPFSGVLINGRRFGKNWATSMLIKQDTIIQGPHAPHFSMNDEATEELKKIKEGLKPLEMHLHITLDSKSSFTQLLFSGPLPESEPPETLRERALRLKQQPHPMAESQGFDRKGRKK